MGVTAKELLDTQRAFDTVAGTYDESNASNALLCAMRQRTLEAVTSRVPRGSMVLDLGCGPGADAETLARLGYRLTAIDWSPDMARAAEQRIRRAHLTSVVDVRHLGIHQLDRLGGERFDAAYSNFGPLNCVPDLKGTARVMFERLKPRGLLVASVIGRVCPWEIVALGLRGDWQRVRVRFARDFVPVPFYGRTVWTRYYSPREFIAPFEAAGFATLAVRALGLLVPPPYMDAFARRHPGLIGHLQTMEDRVADWPGLCEWGDHSLVVMRRA